MALWNKLTTLPDFEKINTFYNEEFPLEVRFVCASWIEENILDDLYLDNNDPQLETKSINFMSNLIQQLHQERQKLQKSDQMSLRCRIDDALQKFTNTFYNPLKPYRQIREAIINEKHFLEAYSTDTHIREFKTDPEINDINCRLAQLRNAILQQHDMHSQYKQEAEQYLIHYNESTKQIQSMALVQGPEMESQRLKIVEDMQMRLNVMLQKLTQQRNQLCSNIGSINRLLDAVQKIVIHQRLGRWQKNQASAGNGAFLDMSELNQIQAWFEELGNSNLQIRSLIEKAKNSGPQIDMNASETLDNLLREISTLLQNLIVAGFIVERQPPQVMKTHTRFTAIIRLLTTNVGIQMVTPIVTVSILSEAQAQNQQMNHATPLSESSGEILNNSGPLEFQQTNRQLTCNLRNMQLKRIKRAEKKGTESVMDEKFGLLFQSKFHCGDMQLNVWVMSLPVVVTVHGNQEPQSWATVTWDNAFAEVSRIPFAVVDRIKWGRVAETLNMKFASATGRQLTQENLYYLCEKMFRCSITADADERIVTWTQFCKEPLPDRQFTFWEWFFAVMRLTKDQLRGPWKEGLILGFINKKQAEDMLKTCQTGTFLLRFSDSELGGITVAWVDHDGVEPRIVMLAPFSHKDFGIRSLGDRLKDLTQCMFLYPNRPKDLVFHEYYTPVGETTTNGGYVKHTLKSTTVMPDTKMNSSSYPNTPQHSWQSPDPHSRDTASVQSYQTHANENALGYDVEDLSDDIYMQFLQQ